MSAKTASINMRVAPSVRSIIDAAAEIASVDRTVFVQQAALNRAYSVLADQRLFHVEQQAFDALDAELKSEPKAIEGLAKLLAKVAPWE